ncbi:MAG: DEAD/DEAH box helicase [Methanogenium sp.]|jgi:DNA repair protein RadD
MRISVIKERTKLHSYALVFQYHPSIIEACRFVKEKYGWDEFSYDADTKRWRFTDLSVLDEFEEKFELDIDMLTAMDRVFYQKPVTVNVEGLEEACRKEVESLHVGDFTLRDYQVEALTRVLVNHKKNVPGNELIVACTGAGKSLIIAGIAKLLGSPILILQPTREILVQNLAKLSQYVPEEEIGVYSASMKQKSVKDYTLATIQSIYRKPEEFRQFKTVIVDECDLFDPKSDGMVMDFLTKIDVKKVYGLTATPYRMATGYYKDKNGSLQSYTTIKMINRLQGKFWKRILIDVSVEDLQKRGYLSPLKYIDKTLLDHELLKMNKSQSDFDMEAYDKVVEDKMQYILDTIKYAESNSKSVLVFCNSVESAEKLSSLVPGSVSLNGKTPKKEREQIVEDFKSGKIKTVFQVLVFSCGFDFPSLDTVIMLRPTRSLRLHFQTLGRVLRIAPGKECGTIIDLAGNVKNIGRIETIKLIDDNGLWDVETEKGRWHNQILYSFDLKQFV